MKALWILVAIGFCFALGSGLQMQRNQHGVDDFDQFYVGARLAFSGHLYDPAAQFELQRETVGVVRPEVSSSRLPFYYAMLWPLGRLPYSTARAVWFALMILAAGLFVVVYPTARRSILAASVAVSLPLFAATLGQRQDLALVLLILAVSLLLRARGFPVVAGVVLALVSIKIHLFLLVPIALLMRREWRMLFGLAGGGVALLGISFAVAGRGFVSQYLALISNPGVISDPAGKPNLHGLFAGVSHAAAWEVILSAAVVAAVVAVGWRSGFEIAFAAGLLGSFLVSNHAYVHDCAVLIPALVEIVRRQPARPAVVLGIVLLTPLPYFLPALLIHIREGVAPAVLIAATLTALLWTAKGENKA